MASSWLDSQAELAPPPPPPPPTVVCIAEMDNILLMMRLFLVAFLPVCSLLTSVARGDLDGPPVVVAGGCWPLLLLKLEPAKQAAELASEGSALTLANSAAALCLLSSNWPPEAELPPPLPAPNSCEAVIWRWNRRGPVLAAAPVAGPPLVAGALEPPDILPLTLLFALNAAALLEHDEFSALVLSWRWNIELVVYLDWTGWPGCDAAATAEADDDDEGLDEFAAAELDELADAWAGLGEACRVGVPVSRTNHHGQQVTGNNENQ